MFHQRKRAARLPLIARVNWLLAFMVIWFVTLPSLDKSITSVNKDGATCHLHPSRGTLASTTCIDGQWYIRTGRGFKKCSPWLGELRQRVARKKRYKAIADRAVVSTGTVASIAGVITVLTGAVR